MAYSSTLTSKGQVTVPVTIRRRLGLKAGELVRFRVTKSNQVLVEKNSWKEKLNNLHSQVASHLKSNNIKPLGDEALDRAIDREAAATTTKEWRRGQA